MAAAETITVNGVATHVLRGGEGPPLVYLHGAAPAGEWLPIHRRLAQRFSVYAPDHPGFGHTPRPEWLTEMVDLVLHYEELFRALNLAKPAIAGFSLGGWIAAEFAAFYPDRVGALVLLYYVRKGTGVLSEHAADPFTAADSDGDLVEGKA